MLIISRIHRRHVYPRHHADGFAQKSDPRTVPLGAFLLQPTLPSTTTFENGILIYDGGIEDHKGHRTCLNALPRLPAEHASPIDKGYHAVVVRPQYRCPRYLPVSSKLIEFAVLDMSSIWVIHQTGGLLG